MNRTVCENLSKLNIQSWEIFFAECRDFGQSSVFIVQLALRLKLGLEKVMFRVWIKVGFGYVFLYIYSIYLKWPSKDMHMCINVPFSVLH